MTEGQTDGERESDRFRDTERGTVGYIYIYSFGQ